MSFNIGDTIRCIDDTHAYTIKKGDIFTVEFKGYRVLGDMVCLKIRDRNIYFRAERFEMVKEAETKFDMVNQPWFIRINCVREFNVVQDFLKEKLGHNCPRSYDIDLKYLTNVSEKSGVDKFMVDRFMVLWAAKEPKWNNVKEIKVKIKNITVIDHVVYPEVMTPEQEEIQKIEIEMRKLADRLNKLKGK